MFASKSSKNRGGEDRNQAPTSKSLRPGGTNWDSAHFGPGGRKFELGGTKNFGPGGLEEQITKDLQDETAPNSDFGPGGTNCQAQIT